MGFKRVGVAIEIDVDEVTTVGCERPIYHPLAGITTTITTVSDLLTMSETSMPPNCRRDDPLGTPTMMMMAMVMVLPGTTGK